MKEKISILLLASSLLLFACKGSTGTTTIDNADSTRTVSSDSNPNSNINTNITGTYVMGNRLKESDEGGGYFAAQQIGDSLKFELTIMNGGPGYHSGTATGMMPLKNNVAIFTTNEFAGECQIVFTFKGNEVEVNQAKGGDFDCGFGQGVMAYGTFKKEKNEAVFEYEGGF